MALPEGLVADLLARARLDGVNPGDLLVDVLCAELPGVLAEAAATALRPKGAPELELRGADELDSTPLVELDSTARRLQEGASGASTT